MKGNHRRIRKLLSPRRCQSARRHSSTLPSLNERPFRVGIVGAGPAGFYAAGRILSAPGASKTEVDLFEVLPVPFGLARYGVAPDHPEVKNCEHHFERTAEDPRFRFFGNVQISGDLSHPSSPSSSTLVPNLSPAPEAAQISLAALQPHYDALLLTYGASLDRSLGIPGEQELMNVLSARSFVGWYNGHPSSSSFLSSLIDLSKIEHVTVIGQGNVAIDVARMLLKGVDEWKGTDLPEYVLAELARSKVKKVEVVGRRGALQLAATTKELREMMNLEGVGFSVDPEILEQAKRDMELCGGEMERGRMRKRALGLLEKGSKTKLLSSEREWSLEFLQSPARLLPSASASIASTQGLFCTAPVGSIEYALNILTPSSSGSKDPTTFSAQPKGETVRRKTDLVFKSVGYRSIGLPGFPFDERKGVVRNDGGRVVKASGERIEGLYTSGWLARGPNGVIATTMYDAYSTADLITADLAALPPTSSPRPRPDFTSLAGGRRVVSWQDWEKIDAEERKRGVVLGKPREKITSVEEMLALL